MKIAIVGAGVAGITAAYLLDKAHQVTLIERNGYLGGHTNTIEVPQGQGAPLPVDTGFIVCNPLTYPNFYRWLNELGVARRDSNMSFGFSCDLSGLAYIGPALKDFVRVPSNLVNPKFLGMLLDQYRFNTRALADLKHGKLASLTLGSYMQELGVSDFFVNNFIIPLGGAIWSSPDSNMLHFPAETFITFFKNHGVLQPSKQPIWQTVVGGSYAYIKAFLGKFKGRIIKDSAVKAISRPAGRAVVLQHRTGEEESFDKIVLATHADEALALLQDATDTERALLGTWKYHSNRTVLHTDQSVMPVNRNVWASWNYRRTENSASNRPISITYYMNKLQGLNAPVNYLVTLNNHGGIDPAKIIYETNYTHPEYTQESVRSQQALTAINGSNCTYFCGSYMRYGFHEDAVWSAVNVARSLGVQW